MARAGARRSSSVGPQFAPSSLRDPGNPTVHQPPARAGHGAADPVRVSAEPYARRCAPSSALMRGSARPYTRRCAPSSAFWWRWMNAELSLSTSTGPSGSKPSGLGLPGSCAGAWLDAANAPRPPPAGCWYAC